MRPGEVVVFSYPVWLRAERTKRRLRWAFGVAALALFLAACWAWWALFPEGGPR